MPGWHGGIDLLSFTTIFKNRSIPSSLSVLFLLPPTTNSGSISFVASVHSGQVQCLADSFRIFLLADFLRRGFKKHGFCRHFVENMRVKKDGICFECRTYIIGGTKVKCCYNNDFFQKFEICPHWVWIFLEFSFKCMWAFKPKNIGKWTNFLKKSIQIKWLYKFPIFF